jgi:serine protease
MRNRYTIALVCLSTSALPLLMTSCGGDSPGGPSSNHAATGSVRPTIPPGYSSTTLHVKFREGTNVDSPLELLPPGLRSAVASHNNLFTLPKQKLKEFGDRARSRSGRTLPDLNLWIELTLQPGTDAAAFLEELKRLPSVEIAEPAPLPQPPPATTPDFSGTQGYLDAAPGGVEARFAFTIPGGNGSGVTIYDVEYNWLQTHEDLGRASSVILLLNPGDSNSPPGFPQFGCPAPCHSLNREHGTAVLGVMIADNNTKGVTGISWGANIGLAPAHTLKLGPNAANAILLAVDKGSAGDIILLEQQAGVCRLNDDPIFGPAYGPVEWLPEVFQVIQTAVAQGFVVVEAAGNGNVNLDQAACGGLFDRTVRDSGAIIVGAGQPPSSGADRQRIGFSTFGSRVDLQGWGDGVATTGYGTSYHNPDAPTNPDFWYTGGFGGTSSASPIVAGAVANLQGIALAQSGIPLTPSQVVTLLVQTGSPQLGNTAEHIGPRPDLRRAYAQLAAQMVTFTVTTLKGGTGTGSVMSTPGGIDCGGTCIAQFKQGTTVNLFHSAGSGSMFAGWSGGCSGTGPCVASSDLTVTAIFNILPPPTFTVTVNKTGTGTGSVTSTPVGISCDPICNAQFSSGTMVTLTAISDARSIFTGWSGGACTGAGTCVLNSTATVSATFDLPASNGGAAPASSGGGGGCTLAQAGTIDALMPTLLFVTLGALFRRVRGRSN